MNFLRYIIARFITYILIILIGITIVFIAPRFTPRDPVLNLIARITSQGAFMDPEAVKSMQDSLLETFGLKGTLFQQYINFLKRAIRWDFGPSLSVFPTPVNQLIKQSLPWTIGLLLTTTIISWIVGNLIGLVAGYKDNKLSKALEALAIIVYPIPYYIMALILILLFVYLLPLFPMSVGGYSIGMKPSFSLRFILSVLQNSFLPALSMIIVGYGWWFISMKALTATIKDSDYVFFARAKGLTDNKIMRRYVLRNALLPQMTQLAMVLGNIFGGALLTEMLFTYPGIGTLMYSAISNSDFNLMMGIATLSVTAVATAGLLIDFIYPFIDPRIRYK